MLMLPRKEGGVRGRGGWCVFACSDRRAQFKQETSAVSSPPCTLRLEEGLGNTCIRILGPGFMPRRVVPGVGGVYSCQARPHTCAHTPASSTAPPRSIVVGADLVVDRTNCCPSSLLLHPSTRSHVASITTLLLLLLLLLFFPKALSSRRTNPPDHETTRARARGGVCAACVSLLAT